jgi:hypothetical protein
MAHGRAVEARWTRCCSRGRTRWSTAGAGRSGARVFLAGRTLAHLEAVATAIRDAGGPAVTATVSLYQLLGYNLLVVCAILALRVLVLIFRPDRSA